MLHQCLADDVEIINIHKNDAKSYRELLDENTWAINTTGITFLKKELAESVVPHPS